MHLRADRVGSAVRRCLLGVVAGSLTAAAYPLPAVAAPPTTPYLAEIHYDNDGADTGEFVEVHLPAGTTSAGLSVVLYNGSTGALYDSDPVPAVTAPADAPGVAVVTYPANGIQNGDPDGVALVNAAGTVMEFLSYEGTLTASNGPAAGRTSRDIGVREAGTEPAGRSLSRTYDAAADALVWRGPAPATPGAVNATAATEPVPVNVCALTPTREIGEVQGTGATTPYAGQSVTVRGVVVGDVPGLSGFYLQDADGDGDAATSDGIFVFSTVAVDLGDTVAVTGPAQEFPAQTENAPTQNAQTQISARGNATVCADGTTADLPAAAALDLPAGDAQRERLEGMLVQPVDTLTVSEVFDLTSFGELTLSEGGLLVQPTELARPGTDEAEAVATENQLRRIVLDDALTARVTVTTRPYLSPTTPVRVGDEVAFTKPLVLGYGFGRWRRQPADGTAAGSSPRATPARPLRNQWAVTSRWRPSTC